MVSVRAGRRPATPTGAADPDAEVMLRVQRDEPEAFAELVERLGSLIFARLYRMCRDRQEAEDLTQEVFLRIYRARHRYEPRARFSTWLYHVTQNVGRNALRQRCRRGLRFEPIGGAEIGAGQPPPSSPLEQRELAQMVRGAVAGLAGRQRTALEMFQFQDRSYVEIAAALAISPEAIKSLLYRARNQLRMRLEALA